MMANIMDPTVTIIEGAERPEPEIENSDPEDLDAYQSKLDNFQFPDEFVQLVRNELDAGVKFFPAMGHVFFESLEQAGLLNTFDNKFDPAIKRLIGDILDVIKKRYFGGFNPTNVRDNAIRRGFHENMDMILISVRTLLRSLYIRNLDQMKIDAVSMERDQVKGQVKATLEIAYSDALTGMPNRRAFGNHLKHLIKEKPGEQMAFLLFDADLFKSVNERYGYPVGNKVLRELARIISSYTKDGMAFRYGGEEFVVMLPLGKDWSVDQVLEMSNKVRKEFSEIIFEATVAGGPSEDFSKTCSCGIAIGITDDLRDEGVDIDEVDVSKLEGGVMFKKANQLLTEAKVGGRNMTILGGVGHHSLEDSSD